MGRDLDLYREQHRELLAAASELEALADGRRGGLDGEARVLLARLGGKLTVHLQMEDQGLYPDLLASRSDEVRRTAARFKDEMGALHPAASAFLRRWLSGGAIERQPEAFLAELRPLLHALAERIAAEDGVLYPLAERAD